MNRMLEIKCLASVISEIIEHAKDMKVGIENVLEYRNEQLAKAMEQENPNEYDIKYAQDHVDEKITELESVEKIINYLESYKF